ncbi:leucine-rich repeat domain-containing protein, partial [Peptoniphilus catoniae]|uniref:leucine-rich repeat domain-containing protein n=1 Tax=Peptoniphilus catoniae TaxID=1660341 RepID=UPI001C56BE5A
MKKKRGRRIAMLLAMMMLIMNLIVSPVWAGPGDVAINETNFPNYYFRNYVSKKLDKDHDGKLSDAEIAGIKSIDVRDIYLIKNLKGIEYFTALQTLNCDGNRLSTLDISKNAALQKLVCSNNQLTNLDVSNNPALEYLYCGANQLTNLDVSNNPALEYLYCGATQLTNLDVSNNPALKYLNCGNNRLK